MSERLKEIKKELELDWSDISYVVNQDDVKWLINRVEELEDFKRNAEQLYKNYHLSAKKSVAEKEELREQNKRYREALEEIARGRFPGASYKAKQALEGK